MSSDALQAEQRHFDALSARIAAAIAAGDERTARRLGDEAVATVLLPSAPRLLRTYRRHTELFEDFVAEALRRVWADWRKGKQVTWASLRVIYQRTALDLLASDDRHASRAASLAEGTEAEFETMLHGHAATRPSDIADGVLARIEVERFVDHLREIGRPAWADYAGAWADGHRRAPDISHATGIASGRVRQLRMELAAYVRAYRPDLATWLEVDVDETVQGEGK